MRLIHIIQPLPPPSRGAWREREPGPCSGEGLLHALVDVLRERAGGDAAIAHAGVKGCVCAQDTVVVLGGRASVRGARAAGLREFAACNPALGLPRFAGPRLRQLVRTTAPFDAGVCWGTHMAALARRVPGVRTWAHVCPRTMQVHVEGPRGAEENAETGLIESPLACTWREPAALRARVRQRLGIAPEELTLALISDGAHPAAVIDVLRISTMLRTANIPLTLLVPRAVAQLARCLRHTIEGDYVRRLIVHDELCAHAASAADVAVCAPELGPGDAAPAGDSLRWTCARVMAAGVPVVLPPAWAERWRVGPELGACISRSARTTHLATALLAVLEDAVARADIAPACRAWAAGEPGKVGTPASALLGAIQGVSALRAAPRRAHAPVH